MSDRPAIVICLCVWDDIKPHTMHEMLALATASSAKLFIHEEFGEVRATSLPGNEHGIVRAVICQSLSLIPQCRNSAIQRCLTHVPDFSHILFIDHDMSGFNMDTVRRLHARGADVISPLMTFRSPPFDVAAAPLNRRHEYEGALYTDAEEVFRVLADHGRDGLVECTHAGTGMMLISRRALDAVCQQTLGGDVWFTLDRPPPPDHEKQRDELISEAVSHEWPDQMDGNQILAASMKSAYELGLNAHRRATMMGEDVIFCWEARSKGLQIWLDTTLSIEHVGDRRWSVTDALRMRQQETERRKALGPLIGQVSENPTVPHIGGNDDEEQERQKLGEQRQDRVPLDAGRQEGHGTVRAQAMEEPGQRQEEEVAPLRLVTEANT